MKAAISLDGGLWRQAQWTQPVKPLMLMFSTPPDRGGGRLPVPVAPAFGALSLMLRGVEHITFEDSVQLPVPATARPALRLGTIDGARMVKIASEYVRAFFGKHLSGVDSPLLKAPSPDYPEVEFR